MLKRLFWEVLLLKQSYEKWFSSAQQMWPMSFNEVKKSNFNEQI